MEWLPTPSCLVASVAMPPATVTAPPRVVPSLLNVTVPVSMPPTVDETVAVNVTCCPNTVGDCDDVSTVVLGALFTTWAAEPAAPANVASPP